MLRGFGLGIKSRGGNRRVVTVLIINFNQSLESPLSALQSEPEVFPFISCKCDFAVRFDSEVSVSIPHAKKNLWLEYH